MIIIILIIGIFIFSFSRIHPDETLKQRLRFSRFCRDIEILQQERTTLRRFNPVTNEAEEIDVRDDDLVLAINIIKIRDLVNLIHKMKK